MNAHVIKWLSVRYNALLGVMKGHSLKPEYGGFIDSTKEKADLCRAEISKLQREMAIEEEYQNA